VVAAVVIAIAAIAAIAVLVEGFAAAAVASVLLVDIEIARVLSHRFPIDGDRTSGTHRMVSDNDGIQPYGQITKGNSFLCLLIHRDDVAVAVVAVVAACMPFSMYDLFV